MEPVISERTLAVSSGEPIEASRKGKAPPLERGRGKAFPTCKPDRVTAEAVKRRNNGLHLQNLGLQRKSTCSPTTIKISEETPGYWGSDSDERKDMKYLRIEKIQGHLRPSHKYLMAEWELMREIKNNPVPKVPILTIDLGVLGEGRD